MGNAMHTRMELTEQQKTHDEIKTRVEKDLAKTNVKTIYLTNEDY